MPDNKRLLYDALSQDYDLGTFEQFSADIQDDTKRRRLYDATSEEYDYGDYDSFSKQLGFGQAPVKTEDPYATSSFSDAPKSTRRYVERQSKAQAKGREKAANVAQQSAAAEVSGAVPTNMSPETSALADAPEETKEFLRKQERNPYMGQSMESLQAARNELNEQEGEFVQEYNRRNAAQLEAARESGDIAPETDPEEIKWLAENKGRYNAYTGKMSQIADAQKETSFTKEVMAATHKASVEAKEHLAAPQVVPGNKNAFNDEETRNWEAVNQLSHLTEKEYKLGDKSEYNGEAGHDITTAVKQFVGAGVRNVDIDTITAGLASASAFIDAREIGEKSNQLIDDAIKSVGFEGDFDALTKEVQGLSGKIAPAYDELEKLGVTLEQMQATYKDMAANGASQEELDAYYRKYQQKIAEYSAIYKKNQPEFEKYGEVIETYNKVTQSVSDALESGLTDSEKEVLKALDRYTYITGVKASTASTAAKAGQAAEQSAEFMLDFILTGGLEKAGAKAATRRTTRHIKNWIGRKAEKKALKNVSANIPEAMAKLYPKGITPSLASTMLTDIGVAAERVALLFPRNLQAYGENLIQRTPGEEKDILGRYNFSRTKANAALNTALTQYIEYWSEGFGDYLASGERALFRAAARKAPRAMIGKTLNDFRGSFGKYLDYGKFNGMFNEMVEELVGSAFNALAGGLSSDRIGDAGAMKEFFAWDNLATLFFSFLPMSALSARTNIRAYNKMMQRFDGAVETLNPFLESGAITEDDLKSLIGDIRNSTPEQLKDRVVEITDKARKANGGKLPTNFAQSLLGYVEGSLAMQLESDVWEQSKAKADVVDAYTREYNQPHWQNAWDFQKGEEMTRQAAVDAGFTEEELNKDAYQLAQEAARIENEQPEKALALMDYAASKARMQGMIDGYREETQRRIEQQDKYTREKLAVNGMVTMAVLGDQQVFVTSPDAVVNNEGGISVNAEAAADGVVSYIDTKGKTGTVKSGELSGAFSMGVDEYVKQVAMMTADTRQKLFETAMTTISPTGMAIALDSKVGSTVYLTDKQGVYEPIEVVRMTDGGRKCVVKGGKGVIEGIVAKLGLGVPSGAEQVEVDVTDLYPMLATNEDGSLATETPAETPVTTEAPAETPAPAEAPATPEEAVNPADLQGQVLTITVNGKPIEVEVTEVGDGKVQYEYKDENGDTKAGSMSINSFVSAMQAAQAPAETPAEAPVVEEEQPEAPAQPASALPMTKDGQVDWKNMFNVPAEEFAKRVPELVALLNTTYGDKAMAFAKSWFDTAKKKLDGIKEMTGDPGQDFQNNEKRKAQQVLVDNYKKLILEMEPKKEAKAPTAPTTGGVPDVSNDTPAAAQQRGYIMQNGNRIDRAAEDAVVAEGKDTDIAFAKNEVVKAKYGLAEADRVIPSHISDQENPMHFFAKNWQPKNRKRADSAAAIQQMANNLRPEEITTGPTAYTGAPIVNRRGEVIQGNGRSEALRRAYQQGTADGYKAWLADHAEEFGLTREQVESMKNPVLVRTLDVDDAKAEKLGQRSQGDLESGGNQKIDGKDLARKLGDRLGEFLDILFGGELGDDATLADYINAHGQLAMDWLRRNTFITDTEQVNAVEKTRSGEVKFTDATKEAFEALALEPLFASGTEKIRAGYDNLPNVAKLALQRSVAKLARLDGVIPDLQEALAYYQDFITEDPTFRDAKTREDAWSAIDAWMMNIPLGSEMSEGDLHPNIAARQFAAILKGAKKAKNLTDLFNAIAAIMKGEATLENPEATPEDRITAYERTNVISEEEANKLRNGTETNNEPGDNGGAGTAVEPGERGGEGGTGSGTQAPAEAGSPAEGAVAETPGTESAEQPAAGESGAVASEKKPTAPSVAALAAVAKARAWSEKLPDSAKKKADIYRKTSYNYLSKTLKGLQRRIRFAETRKARGNWSESDENILNDWKETASVIEAYLKSGEMDAKLALYGVKKNQNVTVEKIREIFDRFNTDPEMAALFDKVQAIASMLGMNISFTDRLTSAAGNYSISDNTIHYKASLLYQEGRDPKKVANTLLHEMIHAVSSYALYLKEYKDAMDAGKYHFQSTKDNINAALKNAPKGIFEAAEALDKIYEQVRKSGIKDEEGKRAYGLTNSHEMLAELSDPHFREELKKVNLWDKIIAAIARLINALSPSKSKNAYEATKAALEQLLDNFDMGTYNDVRDLTKGRPVWERRREQNIDEEESIRAEAIADGTFMKAPNGKPTKLTEKQWLQVRTRAFKNWFGDWELAGLIRQAREAWSNPNSKNKYIFAPSDKLAQAYKDLLGHEVKQIVITDDAIRHIKKNHGQNEGLRGQVDMTPEDIAIIPYVLNNYDTIAIDEKGTDKLGHRLVSIRKRINGISVVATVERGENKEFVVTEWVFVKSNALDAANTTPGLNVRNDFDATKIKKEIETIKNRLNNSSKVVDENGEPLVVYHASNTEGITEFDKDKIRANETDAWYNGFWFSSDEDTLPAWVKKNAVYPVYLNIRKPILRRDANKVAKEVRAKLEENEDAYPGARSLQDAVRMELQARGYDGVIHEYPADIDFDELEKDGKTVFTLPGGLRYIIRKGDDYKYEAYEYLYDSGKKEYYEGDLNGGFDSIEEIKKDPYFFGEQVWVAFEPNQIKSAELNNGEFNELSADIREKIDKEGDLFEAAVERFGTTKKLSEAGYILPDGRMLDFSGRHQLASGSDSSFLDGRRTVDHRDIQDLEFERDLNTPSGRKVDMPSFINAGAIRIDANSGAINLATKPTPQQESVLRRLIEKNNGDVWVDFGADNTWDYQEYEGAKPTRVINDINRAFSETLLENDVEAKLEEDPDVLAELEAGSTTPAYRAMQFVPDPNGEWEYDLGDGKGMQKGNLYPPMSAKVNGEWREPIGPEKWERSEENPELADDKGYFKLNKGNKKSVPARYNPYFHSSDTMLNDQFSEAQDRNNLVVVEVAVPDSELDSKNPYHAEKAKNSVGSFDWKAGPIQGQLTGTRTVNLSRWDKPMRIVPVSEVADNVAKMIDGQVKEMPTNVVWPQLRSELEKRGVQFVQTDNQGKFTEGERKGKSYATQYSTKNRLSKADFRELTKQRKALRDAREESLRRILEAELLATNDMLDSMAEELGMTINKVSRAEMPVGHKYDKGFYDTETGEMTICMDNITDERDAMATVFHESVAHHGLRVLFADRFDEAMARLYASLDAKGRQWVNSYMQRHNLQPGDKAIVRGMEEYMAHLAESGDFKSTAWQKVKEFFERVVDWVFGTEGFKFTDNELNYILRAAYEQLKNPNWLSTTEGKAFNNNLKRSLGINESDPTKPRDPQGPSTGRLYRDGDTDAATTDYGTQMGDWTVAATTENQNGDLPVKIGMDAVRKEVGKADVAENEDYLMRHNESSSRSSTEAQEFYREQFTPMLEQVREIQRRLLNGKGTKQDRIDAYEKILDYLYAVSGIERTEYKNNEIESQRRLALEVARADADAKKEDIRKQGLSYAKERAAIDAVDKALEAKEAKINKEFDAKKKDWAGLTSLMGVDKENWEEGLEKAKAMVEAFRAEVGDDAALDELWDRIRACTDYSLEHAFRHGLLTRDEYERFRGTESKPRMWNYYLPLRGFAEQTAEEAYNYSMLAHSTAVDGVNKKANGRWTEADNPLAYILRIAENEIIQGNENWARQALYRFVLNAGENSLLSIKEPWYVKNEDGTWGLAMPEKGDTLEGFEEEMQSKKAKGGAKQGRTGLKLGKVITNPMHRNEHLIHLKVNGVDKAIWVNGNPALAQAVMRPTRSQNYRWFRRASRALSNLFTTYSLDFTARNLIRDTIYSRLSLLTREDDEYRHLYYRKWWENFSHGLFAYRMIRLMAAWESGKLQQKEDPTEKEQLFMDFMRDGGATGYTIINSVSEIKKQIDRSMRRAGKEVGSVTVPVFGHIAQAIKTLNEAFELLTRFTTYETSRLRGRSGQRSAYDAKEISVNFNRRGAQSGEGVWGQLAAYLGGTHYFYNAGVQGFDNFLRLFKTNPKYITHAMGKLIVLGMITPLINSMFAGLTAGLGGGDGDDDDEEKNKKKKNNWWKNLPDEQKANWYWNLPEWVRRNNIVFGTGKFYITIPLAVELRAFYGLGDIAASLMFDKAPGQSGFDVALDMFNTAAGILPVNPLEGFAGSGHSNGRSLGRNAIDAAVRAAIPDAGTFLVDVITNRDYTGRPLAKEQPFSHTIPECQGAYASTPKLLVDACIKLSKYTGIDLAPGVLRDFGKNYGGGFYRLAEDATKILEGLAADDLERPFRWDDIPFFSGFTGHLDEDRSNSFATNAMYEYKQVSEGVVRKMNQKAGTNEITAAMVYGDKEIPEQYAKMVAVQKILGGENYKLGEIYYKGLYNEYVYEPRKRRYTNKKTGEVHPRGEWHKTNKVKEYGVETYKKAWREAMTTYNDMPSKTEEEKAAKKAYLNNVQDAWHSYYNAQADLVDALMEEEYNHAETKRKNGIPYEPKQTLSEKVFEKAKEIVE